MAPEVIARKLAFLRRLLLDLEPFRNASVADVERDHYKVERLLELLGTAASDLVYHLLAERGLTPTSYRDAFRQAGREALIAADLAERLAKAAGLRNVLVHLYQGIDYEILQASIVPALRDFAELVAVLEGQIDDASDES